MATRAHDASARQAEAMDILFEISTLLNTGLDRETLAICTSLLESGVNPEALAACVKDLRATKAAASSSKSGAS